jgi:competence ComEA-like helix-hairpin-helix protein
MADTTGKINLNNASVDEISRLPGMDYDKAQTIVQHRPFRSWDDLKRVEGFDESKINNLKNRCTF